MRTPPIHVAPGRVLEFPHGKRRISRVNSDGTVVLTCTLTGEEATVALPRLVELQLEGVAKDRERMKFHDPDEDKFVSSNKPAKTAAEQADQARRLQTVARRIAYVNALVAQGRMGPLHAAFEKCIKAIAERIGDKEPPSTWTAYRWMRRYRRSGYNADVLARRELFIRKRQPKIPPEVKAAIAKHALDLLGQTEGATLHSVTDLALALTARDLGQVMFRDKYGRMQVALTFIGEEERKTREQRVTAPALGGASAEQEAEA